MLKWERGRSNTEFAAQAIDPGEGTAFELQINGGGPTGWLWDEKSWNSFENNSIVPKTAHPGSQAKHEPEHFHLLALKLVWRFQKKCFQKLLTTPSSGGEAVCNYLPQAHEPASQKQG